MIGHYLDIAASVQYVLGMLVDRPFSDERIAMAIYDQEVGWNHKRVRLRRNELPHVPSRHLKIALLHGQV